jgi:hypothetical protein
MAEQMIIRRRLRGSSQKIKKQIFPIFPGHEQRLLQISRKVFQDEKQENRHLINWLNKVLDNLNKVSVYINRSYNNTFRLIPYYDPIVIKEETIPFQTFVQEVIDNNIKGNVQTDKYINKKNADIVRSVITQSRNIISNIVNNEWMRQDKIPKIQRLKGIVEPSSNTGKRRRQSITLSQPQPKSRKEKKISSLRTVFIKPQMASASTEKQQSALFSQQQPKNKKKTKLSSFIKPEKSVWKEQTRPFVQTTPVPLPYFLVHPSQERMEEVVRSHRKNTAQIPRKNK